MSLHEAAAQISTLTLHLASRSPPTGNFWLCICSTSLSSSIIDISTVLWHPQHPSPEAIQSSAVFHLTAPDRLTCSLLAQALVTSQCQHKPPHVRRPTRSRIHRSRALSPTPIDDPSSRFRVSLAVTQTRNTRNENRCSTTSKTTMLSPPDPMATALPHPLPTQTRPVLASANPKRWSHKARSRQRCGSPTSAPGFRGCVSLSSSDRLPWHSSTRIPSSSTTTIRIPVTRTTTSPLAPSRLSALHMLESPC